jgi:Uma2 family endonuclease
MSTRIDPAPETIDYPDSDGLPMAENKEHLVWIIKIFQGLEMLFRHDPTVFVGSDMFWYPVEGNSAIRTAPDVMVVKERTKELRRSYRQWEEGGIAPHVIVEFRSPGNTKNT